MWKSSPWKYLNFLDIASAAQYCNAYLTSLLYLELWHESNFGQITLLDRGHALAKDVYDRCLILLHNVFQNINDPDGIYGLRETIDEPLDLIRIYEHEGDFSKAMVLYDMTLQNIETENFKFQSSISNSGNILSSLKEKCQKGLLSALRNTGQYYITNKV